METFIEQKWGALGIHNLDTAKYNDWIAGASEGDKPWLVFFAYTPKYSSHKIIQSTDNALRNLACFSKLYGDKFNYGFLDRREAEYVYETYDFVPEMDNTVP
jgi:hypothetical protein